VPAGARASPAREPPDPPPEPALTSRGPLLDRRLRWRAGQALLGLAALLALTALARPLAPGARPWARLAVTLALGLGVAATAFLTSLRGHGQAERLAFYAFLALSLDGLGQILAPWGWPAWPLLTLLVGAAAVAEPLWLALGVAALASLLAVADAAATRFVVWKPAAVASVGYSALAFALNRALLGEKRRLLRTQEELARLKHGIDQLDDAGGETPAGRVFKEVSEEGRQARQRDRAAELDVELRRLVSVARQALGAHAVLYFDADREREAARLRAADGPSALVPDCLVPLSQDPFAFVQARKEAFYATDFGRLLWALPYYKGEVKVGTLLAVPVTIADVLAGFLLADRLEIQAFGGTEPALLASFAELLAEAIRRARASLKEQDTEVLSKAAYQVSESLAAAGESGEVRRLLMRSARQMIPELDAAAVVMSDRGQSRYTVEDAYGWAEEYVGREVALDEATWAAWVLRSAQGPYLLDNVSGHTRRMPILVLDEGSARAASLLAVPLTARDRTSGALLLAGPRGAFGSVALHVLKTVANQAAAIVETIQAKEESQEQALRDGLTGLYNRRAFDELLDEAISREERQAGRFGVLLLDLDHFKQLNDRFGHAAGDAALKNVAEVMRRVRRRADVAARYGGEEFGAILAGADQAGALQLAERLRRAIEKSQLVAEGARLSVTASFGLAVWPADGPDARSLLAAADRALYAAKAAGRNRVQAASALPPLTAP
jgi:diguanylate cyclase (GGDEF)-like protein